MTKPITKPIEKLLKPVTKPIIGIFKPKIPKPNHPLDVSQQPTATDIKSDDSRKNLSEQQILSERRKVYRTRPVFKPGGSLLVDANPKWKTQQYFKKTIG